MTVQPTTLADAFWTRNDNQYTASRWRQIALIIAGSLLIALTTQVEIPLRPVPINGQTFGVLFIAALLGRPAIFSVLLYLGYGLVGLPVFSGAGAGVAHLLGPTGGYLVGFALAAYVVGLLCEKGWDQRFGSAFLAMLIGNLIIYSCGLLWLSRFVAWPLTLQAGLYPFLMGDAVKIVLAAAILPAAWRLLDR